MEPNITLEQLTGMSYDQMIKVCSKIVLNEREAKVYKSIVDLLEEGKNLTFSERQRVIAMVVCHALTSQSKQLDGENYDRSNT